MLFFLMHGPSIVVVPATLVYGFLCMVSTFLYSVPRVCTLVLFIMYSSRRCYNNLRAYQSTPPLHCSIQVTTASPHRPARKDGTSLYPSPPKPHPPMTHGWWTVGDDGMKMKTSATPPNQTGSVSGDKTYKTDGHTQYNEK